MVLILTLFINMAYADVSKEHMARAIKEAENLSLNHERLLSSTALVRTIKKSNKEEAKIFKEKLHQLATVFYTDKGFQTYLSGKELFLKNKWADAVEKLLESDEIEKGNAQVLYLLTMSYLHMKKNNNAESVLARFIQIDPFDVNYYRAQLAFLFAQMRWPEAYRISEILIRDYEEKSTATLKTRGVVLLQLEMKQEAKKIFDSLLSKKDENPEILFWAAKLRDQKESKPLYTQYLKSCDDSTQIHLEREIDLCKNKTQAEEEIKKL